MSYSEDEPNAFYGKTVHERVTRISDLASDTEIQRLLLWIAREIIPLSNDFRRSISRYGKMDGIDWGNISYTIFWNIIIGEGPADHPDLEKARRWANPNSCGNLIEAALACATFVNKFRHCQTGQVPVGEHTQLPRDVQKFMQDLATSRCPIMTAPERFLPQLQQGIILVWRCVYGEPTKWLFEGLNRRSRASEMKLAAAEFEALRLGWPGAKWSEPGYRHAFDDWLSLSISYFPERKEQLLAIIPRSNLSAREIDESIFLVHPYHSVRCPSLWHHA